jgi:hypothetical protein
MAPPKPAKQPDYGKAPGRQPGTTIPSKPEQPSHRAPGMPIRPASK